MQVKVKCACRFVSAWGPLLCNLWNEVFSRNPYLANLWGSLKQSSVPWKLGPSGEEIEAEKPVRAVGEAEQEEEAGEWRNYVQWGGWCGLMMTGWEKQRNILKMIDPGGHRTGLSCPSPHADVFPLLDAVIYLMGPCDFTCVDRKAMRMGRVGRVATRPLSFSLPFSLQPSGLFLAILTIHTISNYGWIDRKLAKTTGFFRYRWSLSFSLQKFCGLPKVWTILGFLLFLFPMAFKV